MIMNRAIASKIVKFFGRQKRLLIVAALFCSAEFSHSAPKKFQQTPVDSEASHQTGEFYLYSKVIDSYRSGQLTELKRAVGLMVKAYPRSVHADNALYLEASLALTKGQLQSSLSTLDSLLKLYPHSNKRVSALYLKSQALQQAKQPRNAALAADEILTKYPGSIEAAKLSSQRTLQQ
jgi:TolA-binding protein